MFERNFGGQPAVVVADENTFGVAGGKVRQHLEAGRAPDGRSLRLPRPTHPACRVRALTLLSRWPSWEQVERAVKEAHKTPGLDTAAIVESRAKYITADELRHRLTRLGERWSGLHKRLREQLMTADQLRRMLHDAGCPTHPSDIGLRVEDIEDTYYRARMIRRRYTVLDLATEAGILDDCVEELFAPGGFWAHD
jgi:glycerol-1-phosphate dehydrogenase [NAD(P)+]